MHRLVNKDFIASGMKYEAKWTRPTLGVREFPGTTKFPTLVKDSVLFIHIMILSRTSESNYTKTSMHSTARSLAIFIYDDTTAASTEARSLLRLS
jgi:hypothetical protein